VERDIFIHKERIMLFDNVEKEFIGTPKDVIRKIFDMGLSKQELDRLQLTDDSAREVLSVR